MSRQVHFFFDGPNRTVPGERAYAHVTIELETLRDKPAEKVMEIMGEYLRVAIARFNEHGERITRVVGPVFDIQDDYQLPAPTHPD